MPSSTTTFLRFSINEDVLSLRDLVTCLRIDKKDIHAMRLVDIGADDWNTYEFDINGVLSAQDLDDEFGGTYVLKNVYLNGVALEDYDYDDTESTQETVDSDLLNDTEVEDDESVISSIADEDEDADEKYVDVDDAEEESQTTGTTSDDDSYSSDDSDDSIEKTPEEMVASLQKKFPDITTESPSEEQKSILEKIATFFREEKIALGNYKNGSVKACIGYSPMKDGGILLYF
jgi:hypothetical protein